MTTYEILNNVRDYLDFSEAYRKKYNHPKRWYIREVCNDFGIFDWWNDYLSVSQLKQMEKFLQTAIDMGFGGYACFKVGAKYCSNGMWAYDEPGTNSGSPKDGEALYHSFVSGENYWDYRDENGAWMAQKEESDGRYRFTLKEVKAARAN